MAKKAKSKDIVVDDVSSESEVDAIFDMIEELNPDASTLSENSLSTVSGFIDTGNFALNAIISGSVFGGFPIGRVGGFFGPPATGKTLIVNKIIANAQKMGFRPVYFDSEQALDNLVAARLGCDVSKIKHVPVEIIEECKTQMLTVLERAIEAGLKKRLILCVDSLGGLNTLKEMTDSLEGKSAADMGLRAKQLKSMINKLTFRAAKSETPILFTNHIYENPGDLYPSMIKKQPGGLSPLFIASLLVQLSATNIKSKDDKGEVGKLSDKVSGTNLRAFVTKNRFVPPFMSAEMYLNFKTGLDPYSGLLDFATKMDFIQKTGPTYTMNGEKLGYASTFAQNPDFWNEGVLKQFDEVLKAELTYSNEEYADLKEQMDTLEEEIMDEEDEEDTN